MVFIDVEKAFDSIHRKCIWTAMRNRAGPEKVICIIRATYKGAKCCVLHKNKQTEPFEVRSGVRQGCILSPALLGTFCKSLSNFTKLLESDGPWQVSGICGRYLPFRTSNARTLRQWLSLLRLWRLLLALQLTAKKILSLTRNANGVV